MLFDHPLAWKEYSVYKEVYSNSILYPSEFWLYHAKSAYWKHFPESGYSSISDSWFDGGVSNVCYNCLDRHSDKEKPAIIWYGDDPSTREEISYDKLKNRVVKLASFLKSRGISKGDVVGIYMPMRIDSIALMLACTRIGAIHMAVFAGFSASALGYRLEMANAKIIFSITGFKRGGRFIDLKENVENAVFEMKSKPEVVILDECDINSNIEIDESIEWLSTNDNLFILYTSGSTGKPKGIIHSALQYMIYTATTFKFIFDIKEDDVYFCTSDIGWITGHSYIAYAPLFHGATVVIFEGNPTYPTPSRYWEIIEKERVSIFYTAPTAIRSLQIFSDDFVRKHDISSLRIIGSVGEPINKEAWQWYFEVVGGGRCPIIDTWWQTETGGVMIAPLLDIASQKPCFASKPFFGIAPKIVDPHGETVNAENVQGNLFIDSKWPGICRFVSYECEYSHKDGDKEQCRNVFETLYIDTVSGMFKTGDGAVYDSDFDIRIIGRLDDVINISGHRLSTGELEDAIQSSRLVKECAVVAIEHDIKGQGAFVFAVIDGDTDRDMAVQAIIANIRKNIGGIARPDFIGFLKELPKTRSGKVLRHLLRDIAQGKDVSKRDLSSMANPESVLEITHAVERAFCCNSKCFIDDKMIV